MSELARLQVDILKRQLEELERLQELGGLRSKRELWDTAFTLLKWAARKKAQGFAVGSLTADGVFTELEMPFLEHYAVNAGKEEAHVENITVPKKVKSGNIAAAPQGGRAGSGGIHLTKRKRTA